MTDTTRTELEAQARQFEETLRTSTLPYWRRTAVDPRYGGYRLRDYGSRRFARLHRWRARRHANKHLIGQCRIIWSFSHAHRAGFDEDDANLEAARVGVDFLIAHFLDIEYGGWRWVTTREGAPVDERKSLCGQFMVVFALVEYARASNDADAVRQAHDTYQMIEEKLRDSDHGGWIESASRDWSPLDPAAPKMVGTIGVKSDNVYLHVMEALAELADITGDPRVCASLAESIDLTREHFYPLDAAQWTHERHLDWTPVDDPELGFAYAHAVEFAWLLLRAEEVLGRDLSWDFFLGILDQTLRDSWDSTRGGVYGAALVGGSTIDSGKYWWAQAEMIAALTEATVARPHEHYGAHLVQLVNFVNAHLADPRDGVWIEAVTQDGTTQKPAKAHDWVGTYHDTRALVRFCRAFGPLGASASDAGYQVGEQI